MSVLVILETGHRMSAEAWAAGRQFAEALGVPLRAAAPAEGAAPYTPDGYTAALEELIRRVAPSLVVFAHTYQTRDYAPKLATRFGRVLISDVIAAGFENGAPVFVRQLFQGKFNADIRPAGDGPHFVSIQAGAFPATADAAAVDIETFTPSASRQKSEAPFRESAREVDLTAAPIIVSVGRGIKEQANIPVVEKLAQALGAELAASRPICDAGWLPMERQVGSSGQTVSPKLYVAVGISGAIQHLVGMKGSKTVVAINQDPNAPIFEIADYGIVGDLFEIVPALVAEIDKSKSP
ncbi:MAG: electron transfer flavoprotein subunit alpha/FixB family protein [Acidobacteriota bacterium]